MKAEQAPGVPRLSVRWFAPHVSPASSPPALLGIASCSSTSHRSLPPRSQAPAQSIHGLWTQETRKSPAAHLTMALNKESESTHASKPSADTKQKNDATSTKQAKLLQGI